MCAPAPVKIYRVEFDLGVVCHLRARPLVWFAFIGGAYFLAPGWPFLAPGWPFRARRAALFLAWIAPLFGERRALAKGFARRPVLGWRRPADGGPRP